MVLLPLPFVRCELRALNLYGVETPLQNCVCSWTQPCEFYMDQALQLGFNSFRIPFSAEYVNQGNFAVLDRIVQKAQQINATLILDYHRTWSGHQGDWSETSLQPFLSVWERVLDRYKSYPVAQFVDLYNEYQQPNTPDNVRFWNDIMTQSILHLEGKFPDRFHWIVGGTNWGGNLKGIQVSVPDHVEERVMYSLHKYVFSSGPGSYEQDWDYSSNGYGPDKLIIGEFGWMTEDPEQVEWAQQFLQYLQKKNIRNTAFWTVAHSHDTNGIWKDSCVELDQPKVHLLQLFWDADRHLQSNDTFPIIVFPQKLRGGYLKT